MVRWKMKGGVPQSRVNKFPQPVFPVRLYRPHASAAVHALPEDRLYLLPEMQGAYGARSREGKEATRFGTEVGPAAIPTRDQRVWGLSSAETRGPSQGRAAGQPQVPLPQMQVHRSASELARRYARIGRAAQVNPL